MLAEELRILSKERKLVRSAHFRHPLAAQAPMPGFPCLLIRQKSHRVTDPPQYIVSVQSKNIYMQRYT